MKTIAISIDEPTLTALDRAAGRYRGRPSNRRGERPTRSEIVRRALQQYLAQQEKNAREDKERVIWARYKREFDREAAALIREQATP